MQQNHETGQHSFERGSDNGPELENAKDVQIEVTEMPDGSVLYSAEDGENVISVFANKDRGNRVLINGHETNEPEDLQKVGELFQMDINDPGIADPNNIDPSTSRAVKNEVGQVEQELKRALQQEGVTVSNDMFARRMGQMMEGMDDSNMADMSSQNVIDFATNKEQMIKLKRASLAEAIGQNSTMVDALANKIAESGDASAAEKFRQRAYEMQKGIGGVRGAENDNEAVQQFGKAIEAAMALAQIDDIEQLETEAEEGKNEKRAA